MAITKIGTPELFDFSSLNTALQLPTGTTAERPGTLAGTSAPVAGEWRFNTTLKYVEYYDGAAWFQIDTEAPANPDNFPSQNFNTSTYFGNGGTQEVDAKFNEAANFNGLQNSSASYIDISSSTTSTTSSVSLWINTTVKDSNEGTILGGGGSSSSNTGFSIIRQATTGYLGVYFTNGTAGQIQSFIGSTDITDGNWHNVVLSMASDNTFVLYLDGSSHLSGTRTRFTSGDTQNLSINRFGTNAASVGASAYGGKIDQVRIFSTALTTAQAEDLYTDETATTAVTLNFPVGAGCIAAYQLDGDAADVGGTYGGVETDIGYTGLKFEPDFVWIKNRQPGGTGYSHQLYDSIRGVNKVIFSNDTDQQYTRTQGLQIFNTNGFTVGSRADTNSGTMVSWSWYAPTAESISASGSQIASTVRKNVDAGFSIVQGSFATNEVNTKVVGHGLTSPELIIYKATNIVLPWFNFGVHGGSVFGNNNVLRFNTDAAANDSSFDITGTTFKVGSTTTAHTFIAYCFENVAGYQKIGSYVGTSASSNIISTEITSGDGGFEPAFLMIKRTDANGGWIMLDNKRSTSNPRTKYLTANTSDAEGDAASIDVNFLTNGFSVGGTNGDINVGTYIYLAIAADKDTSVPTLANSFEAITYTGNGGTQNISTSFAPDLTWIKARSVGYSSALYDTVRGATYRLVSNTTDASTSPTTNGLTAFNSNGFTLGGSNTSSNGSGTTYVAWNWKAGGLPTINTDGSLTSIVSANQAAGFSVVKYKGNGTTGATFGHGLDKIPQLMFSKRTDTGDNWNVYTEETGNTGILYLNLSDAFTTVSNRFNNTSPTSDVFTLGNSGAINANGGDYIAYCFTSITGYQKIGSYTWTGTSYTAGTMVTGLGFTPRFVMIKGTDVTSFWMMYDNKRVSGTQSFRLAANSSEDEDQVGYQGIIFDSDGFSAGAGADGNVTGSSGLNENGKTYIYLAIA